MAFVAEGSISLLIVLWYTMLQRLVPEHFLGRVMSLDWMISIAGLPRCPSRWSVRSRTGSGPTETLILAGVAGAVVTIAAMFIPGRAVRSATAGSPKLSVPGRKLERMEYTHVGHLGLVVSRLCLGTMNFGPHTPESDSYAIMDSAVAYGINFFDTANVFWPTPRRRRDRGDHRAMVHQGRRPS